MALLRELLQYTRVSGWAGRGALENGELELVEENLAELKVRVDVELHSRDLVNLALYRLSFGLEAFLQRPEPLEVDRHSLRFHAPEYFDQRHFDLVEETHEPVGFQLWREALSQLKGHVSVLAGVVARAVNGTLIEWNRRLAATTQLLESRSCVVAARRRFHSMSVPLTARATTPARTLTCPFSCESASRHSWKPTGSCVSSTRSKCLWSKYSGAWNRRECRSTSSGSGR